MLIKGPQSYQTLVKTGFRVSIILLLNDLDGLMHFNIGMDRIKTTECTTLCMKKRHVTKRL